MEGPAAAAIAVTDAVTVAAAASFAVAAAVAVIAVIAVIQLGRRALVCDVVVLGQDWFCQFGEEFGERVRGGGVGGGRRRGGGGGGGGILGKRRRVNGGLACHARCAALAQVMSRYSVVLSVELILRLV